MDVTILKGVMPMAITAVLLVSSLYVLVVLGSRREEPGRRLDPDVKNWALVTLASIVVYWLK